MSAENVVKAFNMAIKQRNSNKPLIHHSDRGLQYCASVYQKALQKHLVKPSKTNEYDCYQNTLAQRINGILKQLTKESIETYNSKRPLLSLSMNTPNFVHNNKKPEKLTSLV